MRDLVVEFDTAAGPLRAVDQLSYDLYPGETLGVVGETGSGKSVAALAALGLLSSRNVRRIDGRVLLDGRDLLALDKVERRALLGRDLAMVFQDPMSSLNPVMSVGTQIAEAIVVHEPHVRKAAARARTVELLDLVGVPQPDLRFDQYPHEFSGGMRQRAMIAMAIVNRPRVLVADEPTTALDVTVQAQILDLLEVVQRETGTAVVFITHDLGVVAEIADRVCVMYAGRAVEIGRCDEVLGNPRHAYTAGLLACRPAPLDGDAGLRLTPILGQPPDLIDLEPGCAFSPRCPLASDACRSSAPPLVPVQRGHLAACFRSDDVARTRAAPLAELQPSEVTIPPDAAIAPRPVPAVPPEPAHPPHPLLVVRDLVVEFPVRGGVLGRSHDVVHAVDGVDITVHEHQTVGLVGESGCGKSTTGRAIVRLLEPAGGSIHFDGTDVRRAGRRTLRSVQRRAQIVFQDPHTSLNPRLSIGGNIGEPLRAGGVGRRERRDRVLELLDQVGLSPSHAGRLPGELSGGQRQRVGIARALAPRPRLLVLDEPVSSLDVSVQAQVLNLLTDLQTEHRLAYLFISHDLSVIRHMCDRVAVMYLGKIVEEASTDEVCRNPQHPYTQALLSAVPTLADEHAARHRTLLHGDLPNPLHPPSGCRFRTRCPRAQAVCAEEEPALIVRSESEGHRVACHFAP